MKRFLITLFSMVFLAQGLEAGKNTRDSNAAKHQAAERQRERIKATRERNRVDLADYVAQSLKEEGIGRDGNYYDEDQLFFVVDIIIDKFAKLDLSGFVMRLSGLRNDEKLIKEVDEWIKENAYIFMLKGAE